MTTLDDVLNVLVPIILVLLFTSFLWIRTPLGAFLGPHIRNFVEYLKGEAGANHEHNKVIVFE